jgi:hypothetical protein
VRQNDKQMKIAINTLAGSSLFEGDFNCLAEAVQAAVKKRAYLQGAYLQDAYLQGAKVNWNSHAMISEILFRAAGEDVDKRKVAGLVAVSLDWCWEKLLSIKDPNQKWALAELAKWVTKDDAAPDVLVKLAEKTKATNE